jgi:pimeloyl-ACP methyl ester carboxylesterase
LFELKYHAVEANGIRVHLAVQGEGPVVLLCHGFPESWYSWRHQLSAFAEAGYRAVAPDMRGYGQTEKPSAIDQYTLLHLAGDMVGVLDVLGAETAVIAGHDSGASVAWLAALLRPDRFRGVVGLSVPFIPRGQLDAIRTIPETDDFIFYQHYFQAPGVAEAEFEREIRDTFRSTLYTLSGDVPIPESAPVAEGVCRVSKNAEFLAMMVNPPSLPLWISEADIDFYVEQYTTTGFRGGLNWYRNIARNWNLLAPFEGAKITVPALYIAGERDVVLAIQGMGGQIANLSKNVPLLRQTMILPGCGHWTQQERPQEVSSAIIEFLRSID